MIKNLPDHYSYETPVSVHDEEQGTVLELLGRHGAKINEVIKDQNETREYVETATTMQNEKIQMATMAQNEKIEQIKKETLSEQQITDAHSLSITSVYMANTFDPLTFNTEANGDLSIVFPSDSFGVIHKGYEYFMSLGDDRHDVPGGTELFLVKDGKYTTTLSPYERLVMFVNPNDPASFSCRIVEKESEEYADEVVLIANGYGKVIGGLLAEESARMEQRALSKQTIGFMGMDQKLTFTLLPDFTGMTVDFPCRMTIIHEEQTPIEWSQCSAEVTANLSGSGNGRTLILPNYTALVYNFITKTVEFRRTGTIVHGDVVLIQNAYCNLIGGCLLVEWLAKNVGEGGDPVAPVTPIDTPVVQMESVKKFSKIVATGSPNMKTMLFFTDPHLITSVDGWEENFQNYMKKVKEVADTASVDVVICGGDWLDAHNVDDAKGHLSYIYGQMKAMFPNFIHTLGNHDTNYQGNEQLSQTAIENLLFRESGKAYYKKEVNGVQYVVLDSGLDGKTGTELTEYEQEQIDWFNANVANNEKQTVIILHGFWDNLGTGGEDFVTPLGQAITDIVSDFDSTQKYTLVLSGHLHREKTDFIYDAESDADESYHSVMTYAGKNLQNNGEPCMTLIAVDNCQLDEGVRYDRHDEAGYACAVCVDIVNVETGASYSHVNWID